MNPVVRLGRWQQGSEGPKTGNLGRAQLLELGQYFGESTVGESKKEGVPIRCTGRGENRTSKDKNEPSSGTGTSKGNKVVLEEGKEDNKSKVKGMTVLRTSSP